ncbi:MAG TPA: formate dehydrogenase subunit gamma [Plasticicumulans sp.]|nr:formate dehydrogenase subunit gamma [Plasticicumulans sp.]
MSPNRSGTSARRALALRRIAVALLLFVAIAAALPFAGRWLVAPADAQAPAAELPLQGAPAPGWKQDADGRWHNPRADTWRGVREGTAGYSAVTGSAGDEKGVLINGNGENWRQVRNGWVAPIGGIGLLVVLAAIALFYAIRGTVRLDHGRTGLTVQRWSTLSRFVHWYTALLFIALAITGLSLLFGRALLIPVLGKPAFAAWASVAKLLHNWLGPAFGLGVLAMAVGWMKHNFFSPREDMAWLKAGGGLIGDGHPSAGRFNFGEKTWFWVVVLVGGTVIASGLVLDFPQFGQTRANMQLAHLIHVVCACGMLAFAFGHIYIGTIGSEGSLEGMTTGRVDVNWARQHHDLWYEQLVERERAEARVPPVAGRGAAV